MNLIKLFLWYISFSLTIFFSADFIYSNFTWVEKPAAEWKYRIHHKYFDHTLANNFRGKGKWGNSEYQVCTNNLGLRDSCKKTQGSRTKFDIAFIGDSVTEGLGMTYENTFVGMFANNFKDINIANLSVSSYSPSVYLKKVEWFLDKGISFDHLIVFIDISDIQDEAVNYREASDGSLISNNAPVPKIIKIKRHIKDNFLLSTKGVHALRSILKQDSKTENNISEIERIVWTDHWINARSAWTYNKDSLGYGDIGVQGGINKAIDYMTRLHELLQKKNIKLSIGVYPWPAQINELLNIDTVNRQSKIWRDFCLSRCEMYVDTFPFFSKLVESSGVEEVYNKFYIKGDVHFNKDGNHLIYSVLKENYESL